MRKREHRLRQNILKRDPMTISGVFADFWEVVKKLAKVAEQEGLPLPGDDDFETLLINNDMGSTAEKLHKPVNSNAAKELFYNFDITMELWKRVYKRIIKE
jgi:hypothetical protein